MKRIITGVMAALLCVAPTISYAGKAGGNAPIPPPKDGLVFKANPSGATQRYDVPVALSKATLDTAVNPGAPPAAPTEEVTMTRTSIADLPALVSSLGKGVTEKVDASSQPTLLAAAACNTFTTKDSWNSLLWAKMQQT